jgi:hypothetical protein
MRIASSMGPAGTGGGTECVDPSLGVFPNLGPGGFEMRVAIRGVVELIGPNGTRQFLREPAGNLLVLIRIAVRHGRHLAQLGAERLDDLVFLGRLIVRHHDHAAVATRVADVGDADSGIAGRALDDGAARFQRAAPFRIEHDPFRGAILDRPARIHEFGLTEDVATGLFAQTTQANQGRVAHGPDKPFANRHRNSS